MRLLVDTNIFIDIFSKRKEFYNSSKELFYRAFSKKDQIFINACSLKDIYFFMMKFFHNKEKAQQTIYDIYNMVAKVVDCTSDDAINAIFEKGDYEDNVIRNSANRMMCDCIITRNVKDFEKKDINCWTPEEYLNIRN